MPFPIASKMTKYLEISSRKEVKDLDSKTYEMLEETKKVLKSKKLVNVVRFEKNESRLHALLTFCMRMRLPKLFFSMMKGKWHG